jgi:cystathionine gamma-lyase
VTGDGTRVIGAGLPAAAQERPLATSPVLASTYHLRGEPAGAYRYGRQSNPTWTALEAALGELEGGPTLCFSSGMAAASAVLLGVLRPGDVLVLPDDSYYAIRLLAEGLLGELGIVLRRAASDADALLPLLPGATLLWLEIPTNPRLDVVDLRRLVPAAHDAGVLVACDTTTATPLGLPALQLGADFAVASDTKALSGHSDLVLGHVACATDRWAERISAWRSAAGSVPGPFEAWLAHRSLATLDLRLQRQAVNALAVAEFLAGAPGVLEVRHPWLPADPAHATTTAQLRRGNGLVSFTLASEEAAVRFLSSVELIAEATSFGGVHSSAERRARWGGDAVPAGFLRLSCGCEDTDDLVADVRRALRIATG